MSARRRDRATEPWERPRRPVLTTPFERSARFWLNAYPRRWRDLHGEELLGVLEDVARQDDGSLPERLPRAEVLGLVRAGWGLRWRERPPFWRWLGYRLLDLRLPERYWWWVADDIRSPWFTPIQNLSSLVPMMLSFAAVSLAMRTNPAPTEGVFAGPRYWLLFGAVSLVVGYLVRNSKRRYSWRKHVVEGNIPESMRTPSPLPGTMTPTGTDPAITGEPPEERPRS
ncbi:hypothetical protein [Xylanimonas sp. McL0601]|uniref:hypothetical protein n=1 Tax=Xylanimonas sp. McL0601 TaxID=3414739 RepID=UPI003CF10C02